MDLEVNLTGKRLKKAIYALIRLMITSSHQQDLVDSFDTIDSVYHLSKLNINSSIQLCMTLASMTTCLMCETGSRRFYYLILFLYRNILDKKTHDIILRFIYYANNIEYRHHDSMTTLKNMLLISYHIKVVYDQSCKEKTPIWFNYTSKKEILSFIRTIRENVCKGSIITVALLLFKTIYGNPSLNIDWIITTIDESLNIQNIKKYPQNIRILPILFAGTMRLSQSFEFNDPFIIFILSIACAIISCVNNLSDCEEFGGNVSLKQLSRYDNIDYNRFYANDYGNIDGMINSLSDYRNIIKRTFKCSNNIHTTIAIVQKQYEQSNDPNDTIVPSINAYFEASERTLNNIFGGSIVWYTASPHEISPLMQNSFFCELTTNIDDNAKSGKSFLVKGPINYGKDNPQQTMALKLNYYINNFKVMYHIKHIPYIPFFQFINVNLDRPLIIDHFYSNVIEKSLSMTNEDYLVLSECEKQSRSNMWMITEDPLSDYRLHHWNLTFNNNFTSTVPIKYIEPSSFESFKTKDGSVTLKDIYSCMINNEFTVEEKIFKKLFVISLFKACIGVENESIFEDTFLYLDNENHKFKINTTIYKRFGQPRYASYYCKERIDVTKKIISHTTNMKMKKNRIRLPIPLTTFKQREIDFFFKEFSDIYEPIIIEMQQSIAINTDLMVENRIQPPLRKKINSMKQYAIKSGEYMYSMNTSFTPFKDDFYFLTGFMQYPISKILGIDPNVYGIDILSSYEYMKHFNMMKINDHWAIFENWMWSFANKTSILLRYEENEFTKNYVKKPSTIRFPFSIDFIKGWVNRPGNVELIIKNIEKWITVIKLEIEHVSSREFNEINKKKLYPDKNTLLAWLSEVCKSFEMNKKMYENALEGDLWDFCEFHFGKNFIRLFLDRIRHSIQMISKKYKLHPLNMKVYKKPKFYSSK
jgi:hypothetical protein